MRSLSRKVNSPFCLLSYFKNDALFKPDLMLHISPEPPKQCSENEMVAFVKSRQQLLNRCCVLKHISHELPEKAHVRYEMGARMSWK